MIGAERLNAIINLSKETDIVTLDELSLRLNVSKATIRRDVDKLVEQGHVLKTRGGIIFADKAESSEPTLFHRRVSYHEEKDRIARAALQFVRPNHSYMFDSGSTVGALIGLLPADSRISIVTYDLSYIPELNKLENADIIILGGLLRNGQMACHGDFAENYLMQLNGDVAFMGADSVDPAKGIMSYNTDDARLKREMIENSGKVILLCDHSKFQKRGFINVYHLEGIDLLITDNGIDPQVLEEIRSKGLEVMTV